MRRPECVVVASLFVACVAARSEREPRLHREPALSAPSWLSQTGLYADIAQKRVAADVRAYEPRYSLWSDGAAKQRWLRLPRGREIDQSDPDHWQLPAGSVVFKEFSRGAKRLETRVLARLENDAWFMGAFVWEDDEHDARLVRAGARDVRGTEHDVPSLDDCLLCHAGEPGRVLGISAVQRGQVAVPGNAEARAALGYLHANCGHCHNPHGVAWPYTDLDLRLRAATTDARSTPAYRSSIGVPMSAKEISAHRVVAGKPSESGLWVRMATRGVPAQMPPVSTECVDDVGLRTLARWIEGL